MMSFLYKNLRLGIIVAIIMIGLSIPRLAIAQAFPPGIGGTPPTTGQCDWTQVKESIESTESSQGCSQRGPMTSYGRAQGKYQFIPPTWDSMVRTCPNADMCPHGSDAFFNDPICCQVQECAMDNLLASNYDLMKNSSSCQQLLGQTVNSSRYGSCTATESGILAAFHLGGADACSGILANGLGDSDGHTYEADYVCKHGGLPVPGNCVPPPYTPGTGPIVGTGGQIDVLIGQGELILVGPIDPLKNWWIYGLQLMAEQFTASMLWQVEAIGMLLDAKHQLETQRLFQQKTAEAHRDYQPSEQMCTFGTFAKDLAATQRVADASKETLAKNILQREIGANNTKGASGVSDSLSRMSQFVRKFCNPLDNGGGLTKLCPTAPPKEFQNADINYTQSVDQKLSLEIDVTDTVTTDDEEIVFALLDNLFMHNPMDKLQSDKMNQEKFRYHYTNYRSLMAMRGIARNSIANIIASKSETPFGSGQGSAPYIKALMVEFGLSDTEIEAFLGENPSYHAQMEVLTKKMYQNPTFYTTLIDKPANIKRTRAAMRAIKLMQDRDIATALQRREMLLSMILEIRLREQADKVYNATEKSMYE